LSPKKQSVAIDGARTTAASKPSSVQKSQLIASDKGQIFLIDAMSSSSAHIMPWRGSAACPQDRVCRPQRRMCSSTCCASCAIDFSPQYLAAVFDVAAPTFRDQQAEAMPSVRRFDLKNSIIPGNKICRYKANRAEMPGDLATAVALYPSRAGGLSHPHLELPASRPTT